MPRFAQPSQLGRVLAAIGCMLFLLPAAAQASPLLSDDFEAGTLGSWGPAGAFSVQQQLVHGGSWAARATSTGSPAYAYEKLALPLADVWYRLFFQVASSGKL